MRRCSPQGARRAGFTLLEVLAAVLVLGVLYTVLANVAIQGLRAEGESLRRLEASLLADETLARIEAELSVGIVPPIEHREEVQEPYEVVVDVTELELPPGLLEQADEAAGAAAGEGTRLGGAQGLESSVLGSTEPGQPGRLRRIEIVVHWAEADRDLSVTRTTFAFDSTGLESLLPGEDQPLQLDDVLEQIRGAS